MSDEQRNKIVEIKEFFKNQLLSLIFGSAFLIGVLNIAGLWFFTKELKTSIILHYNVYLGVDLIGSGEQILLMPLVGLFFVVVNFILAGYFFIQKERIISHMLSLTALVVQLGIAVASLSVVIVNYF